MEGFLFSLQAEGCAPRTHEYYVKLLRHFLHYAKSQCWPNQLDLLDAKHIRQFLFWVSSRNFEYTTGNGSRRFIKSKPSTAWPYYKALRRLFNWSVEEGFLEENPAKDIHFKAPLPPPIQPYNPEELRRFLDVCELDIRTGARFTGLRNKGMLLLFVDSALRLGELARFKSLRPEFGAKTGPSDRQKRQNRYIPVFSQDSESYLALFNREKRAGEMRCPVDN